MKIKVKKLHPDAVLPASATPTDAGYDLVAIDDGEIKDTYVQYKTGISIEPPPGYHTEIFPRSSLSKTDFMLANSIGLVDEGYRNEILVRFKIIPEVSRATEADTGVEWGFTQKTFGLKKYEKGDRIAQLVIRKTQRAEFVWSEELSETNRKGGFGWTGR